MLIEENVNGEYQARSEADAPEVDNEVFVRSPDKELTPGDFVMVEIEDASEFDLYGTLVGKS